ncbi:MAG: NAD(P)H-dependent oxidoreductase [Pseudomonadota bacterium]
MKALIVYAHPEPKSFNAALKDRAMATLSELGWRVEVSDLYGQGFKATADGEDFTARADADYLKYAFEQTNAAKTGDGFAPDVAAEIAKLEAAELLILQFPMWWFGFPAILKGWVDRVFAAGAIYGGDVGMFSRGRFKGRRAMLSFTTGGAPETYGPAGLYGAAEVVLWPIQNGVLNFVGYDVLPPFMAAAPSKVGDQGRADLLAAYDARLRALDETKPLFFHPLEDFDPDVAWTLRPGVSGRTVAQTRDGEGAA